MNKRSLLKSFFSFLLAFAMVLGAVPLPKIALTARAEEISISKLYVGSSSEVTTEGEIEDTGATSGKASVSIENDSVVLTLEDFVYNGEGNNWCGGGKYAIYFDGGEPLIVRLLGTNQISLVGSDYENGIFCPSLTVRGTGSLTITLDESNGKNGSISYGVECLNLTVDSGSLEVVGGKASTSYGVLAWNSVSISGGALKATGGDAYKSYGIYCYRGTDLVPNNVNVSGGTLVATGGDGGESYGIYSQSDLIVCGGTLSAFAGDASSGNSCGIYSRAMTISGGIVTSIGGKASGDGKSYGVNCYGLTVCDTGSLTATAGEARSEYYTSESSGVCCDDLVVSGGRLEATGGKANSINSKSYGIDSQGVRISGGTVIARSDEAKGDYSFSIGVSGSLDISGGTLEATGGKASGGGAHGIWTMNGDISGGTVIANGGEATDGAGSYGIEAYEHNLILGYTNATDSITASSYNVYDSQGKGYTLSVAEDKVLNDGSSCYSGTLNDAQKSAIAGRTLTPAYAVNIAGNIEHGAVEASGTVIDNVRYNAAGAAVVLTATPAPNYKLKEWVVSKTDDSNTTVAVTSNQFTMPGYDITVSATFEANALSAPYITTQPQNLNLTYGYSSGNVLTVAASMANNMGYKDLEYQWYSSTTNSTENGRIIEGAKSASYTVPLGKRVGTVEYYYCIVTATHMDSGETAASTSDVATVSVCTPKSVTITGMTATKRDYEEDKLTVVLAGGLVNGVESGDTVTVDLSGAIGTMADANAGTDKEVTVTGVKLGGKDAENYTLSAQPESVTVTINKIAYIGTTTVFAAVRSGQITTDARLSLPALPDGASYAAFGILGGTSDLISSHSVSGTTLTYSTNSKENLTSATITIAVTGATNYNDYDIIVTVTAGNKDEAGVTVNGGDDMTVTYGSADFSLEKTVTNAGTETGTWTWTSSDISIAAIDETSGMITVKKVGKTTITAKYESYTTIGEASIALTVYPKPLDINWSNTSFIYDGQSHVPTATLLGVRDGDICTVRIAGGQTDAGTDYSATAAIAGTDKDNYVLPYEKINCSFIIGKADYSGVSEITRTFLYTEEAKDRVELSVFLPEDRGSLSFGAPVTEGSLSYKEAPALSDGTLTYTLNKADKGKSGAIRVTAVMKNYKDFTITVNVKQIALALYEKAGKGYEARSSKELNVGKSFTLIPMFADGTVLNERVVWASTNPDAATVTQDGKVMGRSAGSTVISAQSEADPALVAYCAVGVTEAVTAVTIDRSRLNLGIGESAAITAQLLPATAEQKLEWSVDNTNVKFEVSEDTLGVTVTAVAAGNTKLTAAATDGSGKKAVCSISIGNPVPAFTISGKGGATEVKAGKNLAMQISWSGDKPKNADVIWSVAAADGGEASCIATISDKGVLTGIMAGKVIVMAVSTADPEKSASTTITVTAAEQKGPEITAISFTNADKLEKGLAVGKSCTLKTKLTLSGEGKAAADAVAWISSDSSIASVSQKGVVKAMAPGEVTITALPRNASDIGSAPRAEVSFSVTAPVKKVKLDKNKMTLGTQEGSEFGKLSIVSILPENASNPEIEWSANNTNVQLAAIPADGLAKEAGFVAAGATVTTEDGYALAVRAVTPGVTKITGVTKDGSNKKVTCTVSVRGEVTALKLQTAAGKNGVNDVTLTDDEATAAVEYSANMKAGGSMKLKAVVDLNGVSAVAADAEAKKLYKQYKKYSDVSVSYRSSDTSVLTVNNKGKISVKKDAAGKSATVYVASADGKYTAEITVTVK